MIRNKYIAGTAIFFSVAARDIAGTFIAESESKL
jgi:hypothetical protein